MMVKTRKKAEEEREWGKEQGKEKQEKEAGSRKGRGDAGDRDEDGVKHESH